MRKVPDIVIDSITRSVNEAHSRGGAIDVTEIAKAIHNLHRAENVAAEDVLDEVFRAARITGRPLAFASSDEWAMVAEPSPATYN